MYLLNLALKTKKILNYSRIIWILAPKMKKKSNHNILFKNHQKCRILSFEFWRFSPFFCSIKSDLSGNTVWPLTSGFQKLAKIDHFGHFSINFCPHSKCKCSSLRSQCWMRFFCDFQTPCREGLLWKSCRRSILSWYLTCRLYNYICRVLWSTSVVISFHIM